MAGGTESPICRIAMAGFAACKALVDLLQRRSARAPPVPMMKPATVLSWARAPALSCLEELEHAKARGAKIYAEVIGYGLSGDAFHITAPSEDGEGRLPLHAIGHEAGRHFRLQTLTTSTPMAHRPWPTRSNWAPWNGWSAMRHRRSPCRRRNRPSAICWVLPARSRRSLQRWPSATMSPRRPSTWTIPLSRRQD